MGTGAWLSRSTEGGREGGREGREGGTYRCRGTSSSPSSLVSSAITAQEHQREKGREGGREGGKEEKSKTNRREGGRREAYRWRGTSSSPSFLFSSVITAPAHQGVFILSKGLREDLNEGGRGGREGGREKGRKGGSVRFQSREGGREGGEGGREGGRTYQCWAGGVQASVGDAWAFRCLEFESAFPQQAGFSRTITPARASSPKGEIWQSFSHHAESTQERALSQRVPLMSKSTSRDSMTRLAHFFSTCVGTR